MLTRSTGDAHDQAALVGVQPCLSLSGLQALLQGDKLSELSDMSSQEANRPLAGIQSAFSFSFSKHDILGGNPVLWGPLLQELMATGILQSTKVLLESFPSCQGDCVLSSPTQV